MAISLPGTDVLSKLNTMAHRLLQNIKYAYFHFVIINVKVKAKVKVEFIYCYLHVLDMRAIQSWKWQLTGKSQWCCSANAAIRCPR